MTSSEPERAFVLGLDGVPWPLIDRWTEKGELPAFERIRHDGVAGPLQSTRPANTPVAWPSIATGCEPKGHGLFEFMRLDENHQQRPHTSRDLKRSPVWELLSPSLVGNVPMTYPADPIDGQLVAGMMSPNSQRGFTHPPELAEEIRTRIPGYEIGLDWKEYGGREGEFLEELSTLVAQRRELLRLLLERQDWRLTFFVFTAPDRLQHLIWDEAVILEHYQLIDEVLDEVLRICENNDAVLFVVSDHGFGPISRNVNVNEILRQNGYLVSQEKTGFRGLLSRTGVTKERTLSLLERCGVGEEAIVNVLPARLVNSVAGRIPGNHALYDVAFSETQAFMHGLGSVYINDTERFENGIVPPTEVPSIKEQVVEVFESATDSETGVQPLSVTNTGFVAGRQGDTLLPDLIVETDDAYTVEKPLGGDTFGPADIPADHRSEGVILAIGPGIARGERIQACAVDVAPTLLHALDTPVPARADGEVLDDVFAAESPPAKRQPRAREFASGSSEQDTEEDFGDVENRLRGLGYLE